MRSLVLLFASALVVMLFSCNGKGGKGKETASGKSGDKTTQLQSRKADKVSAKYFKEHKSDKFSFFVEADNGEMTKLKVYTKGLKKEYSEEITVEGQVLNSFMLDLNKDGYDEFYITYAITDDSRNIEIIAYASGEYKDISKVYIKDTKGIRNMMTDRVYEEDSMLKRSYIYEDKMYEYYYSFGYGYHGCELTVMGNNDNADRLMYAEESLDKQTAANVRNFIRNSYLKGDLKFVKENDRKFQFYRIDLNGDGDKEIFVRLFTSFFSGTGGETLLLLDKYGEIITRFTVIRPPVFVERSKVNGWALMLVKDRGEYKELKYINGTYPSNPSVLKKAPYDAPSSNAFVMFGEGTNQSKTFTF